VNLEEVLPWQTSLSTKKALDDAVLPEFQVVVDILCGRCRGIFSRYPASPPQRTHCAVEQVTNQPCQFLINLTVSLISYFFLALHSVLLTPPWQHYMTPWFSTCSSFLHCRTSLILIHHLSLYLPWYYPVGIADCLPCVL
jgi:hypothetical protein